MNDLVKFQEPFELWDKYGHGYNAWNAYQKLWTYGNSVIERRNEVFRKWEIASNDKKDFFEKQLIMQQVIVEIHFMTISLDKVVKMMAKLVGNSLRPKVSLKETKKKKNELLLFLQPYLDLRNTFEHYDDQVLGNDSKNKGPGGNGLSLNKDGFKIGDRDPIQINLDFINRFIDLLKSFDTSFHAEITNKK